MNDIVTAHLMAEALIATQSYDLLDRMTADDMLRSDNAAVRRLGLRLKVNQGSLTTDQCVNLIHGEADPDVLSALFGYLGELASRTSDPTLVGLCKAVIYGPQRPEVVRVAAYKALLYISDRTLEHPKWMHEIQTLDGVLFSFIE
jgi:hypothetical protein